ncbi:unnamed protein product [Ixodes hexagonus]
MEWQQAYNRWAFYSSSAAQNYYSWYGQWQATAWQQGAMPNLNIPPPLYQREHYITHGMTYRGKSGLVRASSNYVFSDKGVDPSRIVRVNGLLLFAVRGNSN